MLKLYSFVVIVCCLKATHSQQALSVGDSCTLESTGGPGECKLIRNCGTASSGLKKIPQLQHCGFESSEETICCPRKPGDISKKKCKEYSKFKDTKEALIVAPEVISNECGYRVARVKRVVGGDKAGEKEFPHMARIGFEEASGNILWLCGGTIISENYILTTAQCLSSKEYGNPTVVRIGVTRFNVTSRYKQDIKISELIRHPLNKKNFFYDDIGLIKLAKPAEMNSYTRPACLYLNNKIQADQAIATGWGLTDFHGEGSNDLLKVTLDLFDHETCNSSYANYKRRLPNGIKDDSQVCAGSKNKDEKDTCQGDSGGPLQIYHTGDDVECMYDIVGITSFGKGCLGGPGVYSRVSNYIEWIENIVWP